VRIVIVQCSVDYTGRLEAHLAMATRLLMIKADGSVLIHSESGSYKPLNWMAAPCTLSIRPAGPGDELDWQGQTLDPPPSQVWTVKQHKTADQLIIRIHQVLADTVYDLGFDPGLAKSGVEAQLQALLADQIGLLGEGCRLIRREYPTPIGPIDILARDSSGITLAVEVKRLGGIDGVEQLSRYLEQLRRDVTLGQVTGVLAAQAFKPQAKVLATDRGIRCLTLDYQAMSGVDDPTLRLF
jgi:RecB family endonuclease NucS